MISDNMYGESGEKYKAFWYWLSSIDSFGSRTLMKIADKFSCPEQIIGLDLNELMEHAGLTDVQAKTIIKERKNIRKCQERFEKLSETGIQMITYLDQAYPEKLRNIYDPPFVLYIKGTLPNPETPAAAMVGSRKCTEYGKKAALDLSKRMARDGIQTISGLAYGIDKYCHKGTLDGGGKTWAVMGCGIDQCYPASNYGLYEKILESGGGIISEYPPGISSVGWHFPVRNRIISALSDCVIVAEAKKKSGTQITVDYALEQNKEVFAVPGRIYDKCSSGCFQMINDGASLLYEYDQIKEFFQQKYGFVGVEKVDLFKKLNLANRELLVYSALSCASKDVEELVNELEIPPSELHAILLELELDGLVEQTSPNRYIGLEP